MTAFFVATVTIKDPGKFRDYAEKAAATLVQHRGETVLRGKVDGALAGAAAHQAIGIVKFPNPYAMAAWFNSQEYQAIVPLRDEAADVAIITYSVPA